MLPLYWHWLLQSNQERNGQSQPNWVASIQPEELYQLQVFRSSVWARHLRKHLKQKLEKSGNDTTYEENVDMGDGKKDKDAAVAEKGCEGPDILAKIIHEKKNRNKVLEWLRRNEKLERMVGKWVWLPLCKIVINTHCAAALKENRQQNQNRGSSYCSLEEPPTHIKAMATTQNIHIH